MSQAPRRINTQRSLNRPTEQRPTEAPLKGQPDFFQEEPSVPHVEQRTRPAAPASHGGNGGNGTPPRGGAHAAPSEPPRRRSKAKKKKKTPMWLPLAVTLAVVAVISGVVIYAASMVNKVEENIKPGKMLPRWWKRSRPLRNTRAMW